MSDEIWLNERLHENFVECGKSGYLANKKETISYLLTGKEDRKITIYNYTCNQIDTNTWIVHYITVSDAKNYYRTSIWRNCESLQLLFHQATELKESIDNWISF